MTNTTLAAPALCETAVTSARDYYAELAPLCLSGLRRTLNASTDLFDRQLRNQRMDITWGTENLTSTCICLIGIDRAGVSPEEIGLQPEKTLNALIRLAAEEQYHGGLGLVIWANAVWNGVPLPQLLKALKVELGELAEFTAPLTTMETAWLTSGLIHEAQRSKDPACIMLARQAVEQLLKRFSPAAGLMVHATERAALSHRIRQFVPNFADQIYSVQALSFAALAENNGEARTVADTVGGRLAALQGARGQWWWHYDAKTGQIAQPFPVYSVHQYGMAPMALLALAAAGGTDLSDAIELGRGWLTNNELGVNLVDTEHETIWRDLERDESGLRRLSRNVKAAVGWQAPGTENVRLKVNYETRPYEWAWCLYAAAIDAGLERGRHIV